MRRERLIVGSTQTQAKSASTMLGNDKGNNEYPGRGLLRYKAERQISAAANTATPVSNAQVKLAFAMSSRMSPHAQSKNAIVSSRGPFKYHERPARKNAGAALTGPRTTYVTDLALESWVRRASPANTKKTIVNKK